MIRGISVRGKMFHANSRETAKHEFVGLVLAQNRINEKDSGIDCCPLFRPMGVFKDNVKLVLFEIQNKSEPISGYNHPC